MLKVYVFPVDEKAAVTRFVATFENGTQIVAEIREKNEAFEVYNQAIREGNTGVLLDMERPDVFTAGIGNLPSHSGIEVTLEYVAEVHFEGDNVRFVLPTTISPRYTPVESTIGSTLTQPPRVEKAPYELGFTLEVEMPVAIGKVESTTHPISVELVDERHARVTATKQLPLDGDLIVIVCGGGLLEC